MRSAARLRNVGLDTADIESLCINVHADAGPPKINHKKTNNERQCRHRFEVRQHLQPNTTDLLHVLHAGDAMHNRAEDDRAMSILIAAMNMSPSGFKLAPVAGKKCPTKTPRMIAARTWK